MPLTPARTMDIADQRTNLVSDSMTEFNRRIGLGHGMQAERVLSKLSNSLTIEERLQHKERLISACEQFLPKHKARYLRMIKLITRPPSSKQSESQPKVEPKGDIVHDINAPAITAESQFEALVAEMSSLEFSRSDQVSNYIKRNHPGRKYGLIAGDLVLEEDGNQWIYPYGIDPKYYARLCQRLGLGNKGTNAVPIDFKPYET